MTVKIDIAIPCSGSQHSQWWGALLGNLLREQQRGLEFGQIIAISSAMPDYNKNNSIGGKVIWNEEEKRRAELTDANRVASVTRFLYGKEDMNWKADWVMWIDDDVVLPDRAISHLLDLDKPFVAGLYFNPNPPKNPIAYVLNKDPGGKAYKALYDYPAGALMEVDSVGMGCTLIHRRVYEDILKFFRVFERPTGSLIPAARKDMVNVNVPYLAKLPESIKQVVVNKQWLCMRVDEVEEPRDFPFYAMEFGRTEDHHFCELAAQVGYRPWVDTSLVCKHLKARAMEYDEYKEFLNNAKGFSSR
jgi:hypothetical protein